MRSRVKPTPFWLKEKMNGQDASKVKQIENAIFNLIYGENMERDNEAKERGLFVLEAILELFPQVLFNEYPELEALYQKIVLKKGDNHEE